MHLVPTTAINRNFMVNFLFFFPWISSSVLLLHLEKSYFFVLCSKMCIRVQSASKNLLTKHGNNGGSIFIHTMYYLPHAEAHFEFRTFRPLSIS
jgi:hypothetical protein